MLPVAAGAQSVIPDPATNGAPSHYGQHLIAGATKRDSAGETSNRTGLARCWGFVETTDRGSGLETLVGEPALIHLQGKCGGRRRAVCIIRIGLHLFDVENAPIAVNKGHR